MERINLGRVGEYGARSVTFPLSEFDKFGTGTFVLLHKRSRDFAPYVVEDVTYTGTSLVWNISATDTACEGTGMAEIQLHQGDTLLAKSEIFHTFVAPALGASVLPEAYSQIIIDTVAAYAADALAYSENAASSASDAAASAAAASRSSTSAAADAIAALNAKNAAESAEQAAENAQSRAEDAADNAESYSSHPPVIGLNHNWYLWDGTQYVDSGFTSVGEKGDDGDKGDQGDPGVGIVSITKTSTSGLVDTYTVLLTNGNTTTFTVTNGEEGKMLDKNSGQELYGWIGTLEEYNALTELDEHTWYWIKEPT